MSRAEEYLRRMRALGYEPSLAGMDDEDIEWELNRMDGAGQNAARSEKPPQPARSVYRPVDPGLQARILRQFGQPYDKSAIPKGQEFYLNGWDNGDEEKEDGMLGINSSSNQLAPVEKKQPRDPYQEWIDAEREMWKRKPDDGFRLLSGGPESYRQDALRLAYSQPAAATSKKYIQDWYGANIWTDPDVLAAATPEEREEVIHRIIDIRGGEGLQKHYNALHVNENDAEAARMNDVKYVVNSLGRVQDGQEAGTQKQSGDGNPYVGGYANGGAEGDMLLPEAKAQADSMFGDNVLAIGRKQLGLPYELGGNGINATDCGKFTLDTYNQVGVDLEDRTAPGQYDFCKRNGMVFNDVSQLRPGDLVFFKDTYDSGDPPGSITHVGIYAGNGKMLHAGSSNGVSHSDLNSEYWQSHLYGFGRPRR